MLRQLIAHAAVEVCSDISQEQLAFQLQGRLVVLHGRRATAGGDFYPAGPLIIPGERAQ